MYKSGRLPIMMRNEYRHTQENKECDRTIKYHTEIAMGNYRKSQEQNRKTN